MSLNWNVNKEKLTEQNVSSQICFNFRPSNGLENVNLCSVCDGWFTRCCLWSKMYFPLQILIKTQASQKYQTIQSKKFNISKIFEIKCTFNRLSISGSRQNSAGELDTFSLIWKREKGSNIFHSRILGTPTHHFSLNNG